MGKCKTKTIQTDLGPFRQNQAYPGIIQAHSGIFRTLCNPDILGTVIYPKPWYIRTRSISRTLTYSQPWYIQNPVIFRALAYSKSEAIFRTAEIVNGCNYFHKLIIFAKLCRVLYFTKQISWESFSRDSYSM